MQIPFHSCLIYTHLECMHGVTCGICVDIVIDTVTWVAYTMLRLDKIPAMIIAFYSTLLFSACYPNPTRHSRHSLCSYHYDGYCYDVIIITTKTNITPNLGWYVIIIKYCFCCECIYVVSANLRMKI